VSSLFDVLSVSGTCGVSNYFVDSKSGITDIEWNLGGCDNSSSQSLTITMETSQRRGSHKKPAVFEPNACGPVYLNEGADLINSLTFKAESKPSNSLFVAACRNESDIIGCVDNDNDGWSVDCGDSDDLDPSINPGAQEICGDGIDNNCSGDR